MARPRPVSTTSLTGMNGDMNKAMTKVGREITNALVTQTLTEADKLLREKFREAGIDAHGIESLWLRWRFEWQ